MRHGHFLIMGGFHLIEPSDSEHIIAATVRAAGVPAVTAGQEPSSASYTESGQPMRIHTVNTHGLKGVDEENGRAAPSKHQSAVRFTILTLEMLEELVKEDDFEIRVSEAEISDKSKGDALSKVIFMLQISWFITQCIARRVQGLEITQLELTTLALASTHAITVILWWHKPLGARTPVHIYLKHKLTDRQRMAGVSEFLLVADSQDSCSDSALTKTCFEKKVIGPCFIA